MSLTPLSTLSRRSLQRAASLTALLATVGLIAFHAALLYRRFAEMSITQPGVIARWFVAAFLLASVLGIRRAAHLRSRHATLAFWMLIALLHVTIPANEQIFESAADLVAIVPVVVAVAPVALIVLGAGEPPRLTIPSTTLLRAARTSFVLRARNRPSAARAPPCF